MKNAKEFYESGGYEHKLAEYDEGGYLGINQSIAVDMLEVYTQHIIKTIEEEADDYRADRSKTYGHSDRSVDANNIIVRALMELLKKLK